MNLNKLICVLILSLSSFAWSQETQAPASASKPAPETNVMEIKVPPKWTASFDSYFYDFEGKRPQENGLYEFGDTTLKMQMMSLQYKVNDQWTMMMLATHFENYVVTKMFGQSFKDDSRGLGDTVVSGVNTKFLSATTLLVSDVGLSIPTGSIEEKNPNRLDGANYPYNMQMGSGTYDIVMGVTPLYLQPSYQVGARLSTILRTTGYNQNGYRLGNQYKADAWVDFPVGSTGLTPRVVGYYKHREGIRGQDSTLNSTVDRPYLEYYYHDQINWDVSAALQYKKAFSPTFALKAEAGVPMAQDCLNYDDVAIYTQYYATLGLSGTF